VDVDGQRAALRSIEDGGGEGANRWYRVVIAEGRNREVRKLFEAVGLVVSRLIRIRYGHVVLPRGLRRGMWVDLDESDLRALRRLVGHEQRRDGQAGQAPEGKGQRPAQRGKRARNGPTARPDEQPPSHVPRERAPVASAERDAGDEVDDDLDHHGPIPNPLQQTFDRRFVQGAGKQRGFSGFGRPGEGDAGPGGPRTKDKGQHQGPRQPDPMQTSVGYIGADTFFRKGAGRGGNRGGGNSGGAGGQRGGFGGGGGGGGRRGGR
jgi:23S rRNA pseudouridine2605 synthase